MQEQMNVWVILVWAWMSLSLSLSFSLSLTAVINWSKLYNLNLYLSRATKFRIYKKCHTKHSPISMCLGRPLVKNTRQEKYTVKHHVILENKLRSHFSLPIFEWISDSPRHLVEAENFQWQIYRSRVLHQPCQLEIKFRGCRASNINQSSMEKKVYAHVHT